MSKNVDDTIEKFDIDSPLLGEYISKFLDTANTAMHLPRAIKLRIFFNTGGIS